MAQTMTEFAGYRHAIVITASGRFEVPPDFPVPGPVEPTASEWITPLIEEPRQADIREPAPASRVPSTCVTPGDGQSPRHPRGRL